MAHRKDSSTGKERAQRLQREFKSGEVQARQSEFLRRDGSTSKGARLRVDVVAERRAREQAAAQQAVQQKRARESQTRRRQAIQEQRRTPQQAQSSFQREELRSEFDEEGEITTGAIKPKPQKRDFRGGTPRDKTDIVKDTIQRAKGITDELKNFAITGAQTELSRGSGVISTSKGTTVATDPAVGGAFQQLEKERKKDSVTEKIAQGRITEVDPTDPRTQGQIVGAGVLIAAPLGGKGIGKISGAVTKIEQRGKIGRLEKELKLEGQTEKIGKDVFVTGGGTEKRPESLFVTRFGKKDTVQEIKAGTGKPDDISPSGARIFGKIDPRTRGELGARQKGEFEFTTKLKSPEERATFRRGKQEGEIKQFGTARATELENILKGRSEKIQKEISRPSSVFVQTKAEKLAPRGIPQQVTPKVQSPFKKGDVTTGRGKAQTFTRQEETLIKKSATPTKTETKTTTPFGSTPVSLGVATQQQTVSFPPGTKPPGLKTRVTTQQPSSGLQTTIKRGTIQSQLPRDTSKLSSPSGLGFRDEITTDITTQQPQVQTPKTRLGSPTRQTTTTRQPPPTIIQPPLKPPTEPIPPRKPPVPFGFIPRGGAGIGGGRRRRKGPRSPFVGNTLEEEIVGIFNKPEINPGRTRVFKVKKNKLTKRKKTGIQKGKVFGSRLRI